MKKGDATRQRIIELSAPLFNQLGFAGCSMADIMEATGLEKGGIYRYFDSKETLAAEAFRFALSETKKVRTCDLEHIPGAVNKLRFLVERFVSAPSPIKGGCPLMNTAVDSDDGNENLRDLAREGFHGWRERLAAIVEQGRRDGEFKKSCRAPELADTIVSALEGGLLLSRLDGDGRALKHVRRSIDLLLAAHADGDTSCV